jgi:hypothetical protein
MMAVEPYASLVNNALGSQDRIASSVRMACVGIQSPDIPTTRFTTEPRPRQAFAKIAAFVPPCSLTGVTLAIRKFRKGNFTAHELVRVGIAPKEVLD